MENSIARDIFVCQLRINRWIFWHVTIFKHFFFFQEECAHLSVAYQEKYCANHQRLQTLLGVLIRAIASTCSWNELYLFQHHTCYFLQIHSNIIRAEALLLGCAVKKGQTTFFFYITVGLENDYLCWPYFVFRLTSYVL